MLESSDGTLRRRRNSSEGRGLPVVWTNLQLPSIISGLSGRSLVGWTFVFLGFWMIWLAVGWTDCRSYCWLVGCVCRPTVLLLPSLLTLLCCLSFFYCRCHCCVLLYSLC